MLSPVQALAKLASIGHLGHVTGIPTSTIYGYISGRIKPSALRQKALTKIYQQVQGVRLSQAGFSTRLVNRYKRLSYSAVENRLTTINRVARELAVKREVSEAMIRDSLSRSEGDEQDWFMS